MSSSAERAGQHESVPSNRLQLNAQITAREVVRITPAGVPILELELQHLSTQAEAGLERQVEVVLVAKAAGTLAWQLEKVALLAPCRFTGFIAKKSRNSRQVVFHITGFE